VAEINPISSCDCYIETDSAQNQECGKEVLGARVDFWGWVTKTAENNTLIRIDISALPGDADISEGLLNLMASPKWNRDETNPSLWGWPVRRCLRNLESGDPWIVDEAIWANYKTDTAWGTAGCKSDVTDYTVTGGATPAGQDTEGFNWWPIDVTALVQDAHASREDSFDVVLLSPELTLLEADYMYYKIIACGGEENERPYLKITYTTEEPPPGGSRNRGYVFGSRLGLPSLPEGWMRRRGLLVPVGVN